MSAARVVEAVDVFKEGDFDVAAGLPVSAPEQFGLEGFEEALDGRVIIAISLATDRHRQPMFAQDVSVVVRTVLAAPIRMVTASLWWPP